MSRDISCNQTKHSTFNSNAGTRLDSSGLPPVITVPRGGQRDSVRGERRGLEPSGEPSAALRVSPTVRNSPFLMSAFPLHSTSFSPSPAIARKHSRTDARTHARTHMHAHYNPPSDTVHRTDARARARARTQTHTHTTSNTTHKTVKRKSN